MLESRLTIVLVTHSAFAAAYADRTVELWDGRIERDGPSVVEPAATAKRHDDPPRALRLLTRDS